MARGARVAVDVMAHATEDAGRILGAIEALLGAGRDGFSSEEASGHYGNPIAVMRAELAGAAAAGVIRRMAESVGPRGMAEIGEGIGGMISGPWLHLRFDKQELVSGRLVASAGGGVRVRVHTPVYGGGGAAGAYRELLGLPPG